MRPRNCEACGSKIEKERKEVLPGTTLCVACAKDPRHKLVTHSVADTDVDGADQNDIARTLSGNNG